MAPQSNLLMTPLATPFKKQSDGDYHGFDNDNLDAKYNGGYIGDDDDYDDIDRICEVQNHLRNDHNDNDKNHDSITRDSIRFKNEQNENDSKNINKNDSDDDDYSQSLLTQSLLASPSTSVLKSTSDYGRNINVDGDNDDFLEGNNMYKDDNIHNRADTDDINERYRMEVSDDLNSTNMDIR